MNDVPVSFFFSRFPCKTFLRFDSAKMSRVIFRNFSSSSGLSNRVRRQVERVSNLLFREDWSSFLKPADQIFHSVSARTFVPLSSYKLTFELPFERTVKVRVKFEGETFLSCSSFPIKCKRERSRNTLPGQLLTSDSVSKETSVMIYVTSPRRTFVCAVPEEAVSCSVR